jgi:hypothetical protein
MLDVPRLLGAVMGAGAIRIGATRVLGTWFRGRRFYNGELK